MIRTDAVCRYESVSVLLLKIIDLILSIHIK